MSEPTIDRPYLDLARALVRVRKATHNPQTGRYLTQIEMGRLCGVSDNYWSVLERGVDRPSSPVLRRFVKVATRFGAAVRYNDLAAIAGYADDDLRDDPWVEKMRRVDEETRRVIDALLRWRLRDTLEPFDGAEDSDRPEE